MADAVPEDRHLEFKGEPYGSPKKSDDKQEKDRIELRRDAAALFNGGGGYIVVGVEENGREEASRLVPIQNARSYEDRFRNVLDTKLEPRLRSDSLEVFSVHAPEMNGDAVIVIRLNPTPSASPIAVVADDVVEFWTRVDKKKRRMTYAEIAAAFRPSEGEFQRSLDAVAAHEIQKIRWDLDAAMHRARRGTEKDWEPIVESAKRMFPFLSDHGLPVRREVVNAAHVIIRYPRAGITEEAAKIATALMDSALPYQVCWNSPMDDHIGEDERTLIKEVTYHCDGLLYDALKYLRDVRIAYAAAEVHMDIMRWASLNKDTEVEQHIVERLRAIRESVEKDGYREGCRFLDFVLQHGTTRRPDQPLWPRGLERKLFGHIGVTDAPDDAPASSKQVRSARKRLARKRR